MNVFTVMLLCYVKQSFMSHRVNLESQANLEKTQG